MRGIGWVEKAIAFLWPLVAVSIAVITGGAAQAATYKLLYKFAGGTNGQSPYAGLIVDANGALYGTTSDGGAGFGTVFRLNPPVPPATRWTKTALHFFNGGNGGSTPSYGSLISDANGALYGMTVGGGTAGVGTIYRLAPPVPPSLKWIRTVLYSFKVGSDGRDPLGGLAFGPDGALYGATRAGGGVTTCPDPGNCGIVFKLSPPLPPATKWTETVIYRFQGPDGYDPYAMKLVFDASGALYGTAAAGGAYGHGVVFRLTPPVSPATQWTQTLLHSFAGGPRDGASPLSGVILDGAGALYGTASTGGYWGIGMVYKLTPPTPPATQWTFTVLRHHRGTREGGSPFAAPTFGPDGALYGATSAGAFYGFGSVYKLTPPTPPATSWTISGLHAFKGGLDGGYAAFGGLVFDAAGALYGATTTGGPANAGTIYQIK